MNFLWGALQITTNNRSKTFHNAASIGPSLAMLVGAFDGGNFVSGSIDSSDRRKTCAYDGRAPYPCGESVGKRFLVEAFLHRDTPKWPQQHQDYLKEFGFVLPSASDNRVASDSVTAAPSMVSESFDHSLIEGCCKLGSLLQSKTKFSRGRRVIPTTKDDDFASDAGMSTCIANLRSAADTLCGFQRLARGAQPGNILT